MLTRGAISWAVAVSAMVIARAAVAADPPRPPATKAKPAAAPTDRPPAQTTSETDHDDAKARARALFEKGVTAYGEGRYFDAIDIFSEVNRLFPNPQLFFNIAKAYDNLGDAGGALKFYRDYLKNVPQ